MRTQVTKRPGSTAIDPSQGLRRGDFSAIVFAGLSGGLVYVDAWLERRPPERTVSDAIEMAMRYTPAGVAIEANAFQFLLAPEFDRQCRENRIAPLPLHLVTQHTPKEVRIRGLGAYLAREKLRFLEGQGCRRLVQQLRDFPLSEYDDGPDALELALRMLHLAAAKEREDPG
jgi:predicted phage terminase large subunit-like protein